MDLIRTAKEMALMAALRAAITLVAFLGRELGMSEAERRAVLVRMETALLSPPGMGRA
jgi:hypothetical protein